MGWEQLTEYLMSVLGFYMFLIYNENIFSIFLNFENVDLIKLGIGFANEQTIISLRTDTFLFEN